MSRKNKKSISQLLKDAYPNLTPEEQAEAGENLKRYLESCLRIWERMERDSDSPN